jgi:hypothetical protein
MYQHAKCAESEPGEAIKCGLTSKGKRRSSTTTGICVLAVPCLADDSHLHPPLQLIWQECKILSLSVFNIQSCVTGCQQKILGFLK